MTCTVVNWTPLYMRPEIVDILFESLRYLQREKKLLLLGFVIMENHLHLIAKAEELSMCIGRFKSFTARSMIDLLIQRQAINLLEKFRFHKKAHKTDSEYQLWEEGSHPQQIDSDEMMEQKLEYIHMNPVRRGYVDDPVHWRYSSARNYARKPGLIDVVTDW